MLRARRRAAGEPSRDRPATRRRDGGSSPRGRSTHSRWAPRGGASLDRPPPRRRRARLRSTAMPTLRLAVKPTRAAVASAAACRSACRMRPGVTDFRRLSATRRNSARRFSRAMPAMAPRRPFMSGGEPLAPLAAAPRQNAAPPDRGHAGAEAVASLADDFARLIGALHGTGSGQTSQGIAGAV